MKPRNISGVVLALFMLLAACRQQPYPAASPLLALDQEEINLGEVVRGSQLSARIGLHNRGSAPLTIDLLETSCKCLRAAISRSNLEPNDGAELRITIETTSPGDGIATVLIHSNDQTRRIVPVHIRWTATSPVELSPSVVDLGVLPTGSVARTPITISIRKNLLTQDEFCRIANVKASREEIACLVPEGPLEAESILTVEVSAGMQEVAREAFIEIEIVGGWSGIRRIPIRWSVMPKLIAIPPRLSLGRGRPGERLQGSFEVQSTDGDLDLAQIQPSPGAEWISLGPVERLTSQAVRIHVAATVPPPPIAGHASVIIVTQGSEPCKVEVPVSVFIAE